MHQKILSFLGFGVCFAFFHQASALDMPDLSYNGFLVRMMPSLSPKADPAVLAQKGRISKVTECGYDVVLGCRSFLPSPDFTQITYEILRPHTVPLDDLKAFGLKGQPFQMLGKIMVQVTPGEIRIRNIFMEPLHRGKTYGSQALETFLRDLRERNEGKTSSFVLEVSAAEERLIAWYKSFGFSSVNEGSGIVQMVIKPGEKVKFPYWKKMKAQKEPAEAKKT